MKCGKCSSEFGKVDFTDGQLIWKLFTDKAHYVRRKTKVKGF